MKTINDYKIWENPEKINIEVIKKEKLKEWKWLNSETITYERNWVEKEWEMITRWACDWVVAILPITSEWNIILTEEIRIPLMRNWWTWRTIWMPAGLVDKWDSREKTVNKELAEETGFKTNEIHYVDTVTSSEWMTDEEVDVFIAFNCTKITEILEWYKEVNGQILKHEEWENIKAIYSVPYEEIDDFMDIAKADGIKKWWKIDCALRNLERKFSDRI